MPPDRDADARAARRFGIINAVRGAGVVLVLLAIAIAQGAFEAPAPAAWMLAILGLAAIFAVPQMLARRWSSRNTR